jgi:F0F1-type ATP synthase assembly protein I
MCDQDVRDGIKRLNERLKQHEIDEHQKYEMMQGAIEENSQVIKAHIDDTRLMVQFIKDMEGLVRVLNRVQKFFKWVAGFAIVGYTIGWVADHWPFK